MQSTEKAAINPHPLPGCVSQQWLPLSPLPSVPHQNKLGFAVAFSFTASGLVGCFGLALVSSLKSVSFLNVEVELYEYLFVVQHFRKVFFLI